MDADSNTSTVLGRLEQGHWLTTRTTALIEPRVLAAVKGRFGEDDRLAEGRRNFDMTGTTPAKPRRRLMLAGQSEGMWLVAYEVGAPDHRVVLVVLATDAAPKIVLVAAGLATRLPAEGKHIPDVDGWGVTVESLARWLRSNVLTVHEVDASIY